MYPVDIPRLTERLNELADAYPHGKRPTEGGVRVWFDTLREFTFDDVLFVLVDLPKRGRGQPGPNEAYKACAERRSEQIERAASARRLEVGFDPNQLRGDSAVALAALANIKSILAGPKAEHSGWIGAVFERLADEEKGERRPGASPLAGTTIALAAEAEELFAAKGRDVLAEYAAVQQ